MFVTHASDPLLPTDGDDVLSYCLTPAQRRYLSRATWVVAADGNRALGLAAHQPAQSEVRLVLEWLVDRRLPTRVRRVTSEALIDGVEDLARADGVHLLIVMLEPGLPRASFKRRGFVTVAVEPWGAWMQKHLFGIPSAAVSSVH
ncbi:MAG: hypothetical protein R2745_01825 [Vicinamibacterales bacterium]